MGNIIFEVDPTNLDKNTLYGRAQVNSLEHLFKVFFPYRATQLLRVTPPSVKEMTFKYDMELVYLPTPSVINGLKFDQSLSLKALVDFHNLQG